MLNARDSGFTIVASCDACVRRRTIVHVHVLNASRQTECTVRYISLVIGLLHATLVKFELFELYYTRFNVTSVL